MKKKIISIGILGMFLLLSCSALSTVGQKVETIEQTQTTGDDLPDLTIIVEYYMKLFWQIEFRVSVSNEGTGTIPAGTYLVYRFFSTPEEDFCFVMQTEHDLKPGDCKDLYVPIPTKVLKGNILTAVVDPPDYEGYCWPELDPDPVYGLVQESNEDNNVDRCFIPPRARSYSSFSPLFLLLSRLPIFDEEFVQELRNNVDILSNGPGGSQFCDALWDARAQVAYLIEWYFDHDLDFMAVFLIYSIAWPLQTIYETFCSPTGAF